MSTELTQDELKRLAELAGKDCWESTNKQGEPDGQGVYFNNEDKSNFWRWQPNQDANQFEQVLFAVAEKGVRVKINIEKNSYWEVWSVKHGLTWDTCTKETYKAEVLRAILEVKNGLD